ncbi:MAG: hypothetical protein ACI4QI_04560 [Candidatus Coproplasma sp.]
METKKVFEKPEIEVVKFDACDVITASFTSTASYSVDSIKDFFNIKV